MNPARDLAHAHSSYWERAFALIQDPDEALCQAYLKAGGDEEELRLFMRCVIRMITATRDTTEIETLTAAAADSGWVEQPDRVKQYVGAALSSVLLGAFFHGYRECVDGDPLPDACFKGLDYATRAPRPWWRRLLRAPLYWLLRVL